MRDIARRPCGAPCRPPQNEAKEAARVRLGRENYGIPHLFSGVEFCAARPMRTNFACLIFFWTMSDVLLQGGRVIDPASGVDAVCDVRVSDGRIVSLAPRIAAGREEVIDCRGRLVLPGLIDTHAHVYEHVTGGFGLNADLCGVRSGVTTLVDQGGPSCMTLPGFRHYVAA